ncbi:MAG: NAD(P)/FAD-dependent oxidoreductase [Deltaproteobacteria bacterium]|nr:NAD(P)/FAD-dependent oxidoreductase [Deltaproteobacteria bacterium]
MTRPILPVEEPITEDDAFLEEVVQSASIPTIMMSIVHLTGSRDILQGPIRPGPAMLGDAQGGLSDTDRAQVRALALEALKAYRDGGCQLPPPPSPETIHEMMSFMVGQEVPAQYVPMMLEEMALDGQDARDVHWDENVATDIKQRFHVIVIGAGMSGLLAAIRLEEAGIPYTVIEKNDGIGGTWYENTYPGCRVDIANHFYCYSFEPNHDWPEHFSQRRELRAYFEGCADKYGVRPHVRFETEVARMHWDAAASEWAVTIRSKDGTEQKLRANAIISGVGQLNRPKFPDIDGQASFEGIAFHSAEWEHEHDLEGRNVAVIGTGASALQLVPEVAKQAGQLYVFQRSPAWMLPNASYHAQVSEGKKWLLKHVPYYSRWYRFLLFWPGSDGLMPSLIVDPEWPHPERSVNALNDAARIFFTDYMKEQVSDPELLEKVVPKYPPFGKRMLQDNGSWLDALQRDNVELVTEGIERITEKGVLTDDGQERPVDVIVFASGFHANRFLHPMNVVGNDGIGLAERWGDDPSAYLGITIPHYPNLFCLYGPATNLAHAGSIIFHSECQVRYIMGCLKALLEGGHSAMECRPEVNEAYNERLDETASKTVWAHPGMNSWYKNSKGRVTTTSPWLLVDYWRWTQEPDLSDYMLS